jgi:hypothetical protein
MLSRIGTVLRLPSTSVPVTLKIGTNSFSTPAIRPCSKRTSGTYVINRTRSVLNSVDNCPLATSFPTFRYADSNVDAHLRRCYGASSPLWKDHPKDQNGGSGSDDVGNARPTSPFAVAGGNSLTTSPKRRKRKTKFIPRKAAVKLSDNARTLFKKLLETNPSKDGILLNYHQSSTGEPRMVFSFSFVTKDELIEEDEG